jgi:glycerol-3-phosphate dehydrogenase
VVWEEEGLITVTGGKLTTFRIMAEQALKLASLTWPANPISPNGNAILMPCRRWKLPRV